MTLALAFSASAPNPGRETAATPSSRAPAGLRAGDLPHTPRPRLPPELWLQHVAGHLDNLADVVALLDAHAPNVRRAATVWGSEAYRQLRPGHPSGPAQPPPPSYAPALLRRPLAQVRAYDVRTAWTYETCGAALAGPYLATAFGMAKLACPGHPLFAANLVREANLRRWLELLGTFGHYVTSSARYAARWGAPELVHRDNTAYEDRAFHAASLARVLLPAPDADVALRGLNDVLFGPGVLLPPLVATGVDTVGENPGL